MRSLLRLPLDIATSFFFAASIGIAAGVVAVSFTFRLGDGLKSGALGFLIAAGAFGFHLYRTYRPARERTLVSSVDVADVIAGKAA